ncbi:MAG: hypothetical protein LUG50_13750 [Planctomycetaceae bacterium]|nr:hypothetical protein [Planctomycetaceae bacterium]
MSAITSYNHTNVGRMFARQNVPSVYGLQKNSAAGLGDAQVQPTDTVSLSAAAPKPLTANFLEDAIGVGKRLAGGTETMAAEDTERLREDRVFAAVSALAMIGFDAESGQAPRWPGGLPTPTTEELDVARRRLAQRPQNPEEAANPEALGKDRLSILSAVGRTDFGTLSLTA